MPKENNKYPLFYLLLTSVAGGIVLSFLFSLNSSIPISPIVVLGFILITFMASFEFWRSIRRWI